MINSELGANELGLGNDVSADMSFEEPGSTLVDGNTRRNMANVEMT